MQYLYDIQHYIDLYDLSTIKACLKVIEMYQDIYQKSLASKELKGMSTEDIYKDTNKIMYWNLMLVQAQEYKRKKETVSKWVESDKVKQVKYDSSTEPTDIFCPECKSVMKATSTKHLEDYTDRPLRVMFLFRCTKCKKQEWVYDNGDIRKSEPTLCAKCKCEVEVITKKSKNEKIVTWTRKCKACGHTETETDNLEKNHQEYLQRELSNKELLKKYRGDFCLSDEEGKRYLFEIEAMEYAKQVRVASRAKYDNSVYQKISLLNKLTIKKLEKLLTKVLEQSDYTKFSFSTPDIGQSVIVSFTLQDESSSRRENASRSDLEKLIKDTLENTNWRLIGNVDYRLGFLFGRLRGYEREGELYNLLNKKKAPQKELDSEKRMKYSSSTWVKLAEIQGEHEGIDAVRRRRLETEPEGFLLDPDCSYTCKICHEGHYGNEVWWNLDGIHCIDCRTNIKEGVIPLLKNDLYDNDDEWIASSQLKSKYGVHPSSVKKLRREGLLHGRDLKRANGSIYETIYLVKENQKFIKKYPQIKNKTNQNILSLDISGHVVQIGELPKEFK